MNIRKVIRESVATIKKEHPVKSSNALIMKSLNQFTKAYPDFAVNYEKGEEIVLNHISPNGPLKRVGKPIAWGVLALAISVSASLLLGGILTAGCPVAGVMIGLVLLLHMALMFLALMALLYACAKLTSGVAEAITKEPVIEAKGKIAQEDLKYAKFFLFHLIQKNYPEINKEELSKALDYELSNSRLCFDFSAKEKKYNCENLDLDPPKDTLS